MKLFPLILIPALAQSAGATLIRHENPAGFRVEHPAGWTVERPSELTIVIRSRDAASFVMIHGFNPGRRRAAEWVPQAFRKTFQTFSNAALGTVRQQATSPDTVVAPFTFRGPKGETKANLLCAIANGLGTVMVIAAPKNEFEELRPVLGRIIRSFSFVASTRAVPAAGSQPALRYVRFQDPREGAFSIDVPEGWRTRGGLFRFAPVDVRVGLETVSTDGQVRVIAGDSNLPTFTVPNQLLASIGIREGGMYSPGYGVNMRVLRYMPGAAFAAYYGNQQAGPGSNFRILDQKDRTALATATRYAAGSSSISAGDAAFSFTRNGEPFTGYCFAATRLTQAYGTATWNVEELRCFTAPERLVSTAQSVIRHMANTARVNPQWLAMQQGVASHSGNTVAQASDYIREVISKSYWERAASQDRISRNDSDARMGIVRLEDPTTGERFTASNGSNYYARVAGTNTVMGNNTGGFPPQLDTRPLVQLP